MCRRRLVVHDARPPCCRALPHPRHHFWLHPVPIAQQRQFVPVAHQYHDCWNVYCGDHYAEPDVRSTCINRATVHPWSFCPWKGAPSTRWCRDSGEARLTETSSHDANACKSRATPLAQAGAQVCQQQRQRHPSVFATAPACDWSLCLVQSPPAYLVAELLASSASHGKLFAISAKEAKPNIVYHQIRAV